MLHSPGLMASPLLFGHEFLLEFRRLNVSIVDIILLKGVVRSRFDELVLLYGLYARIKDVPDRSGKNASQTHPFEAPKNGFLPDFIVHFHS